MVKKTTTRQKGKVKIKSKTINHKARTKTKPHRRNWKVIAIALYITFLLLSTIPFAADRSVNTDMKESYTYHLRYPRDGRQTHYYVERVNTSEIGKIDLIYTTKTNTLDVDVENLKVLRIYCRSMYEDECKKVYGFDPVDNSNYYKWYFIEKDHLTVVINADHKIEELTFFDTPKPYEVLVNKKKWFEGTDYFFTDASGIALSNVPAEHTIVDIYFKSPTGLQPNALLSASRTLVGMNQTVEFDASKSFDLDGTITSYILDFGDGTYRSGSKQTYDYSEPGTYGVILMVRDNDYLVDHAYLNITVIESSDIPEIQDRVPDQVKPEDSPPWTLDLKEYEPIPSSNDIEFYWYLTGIDNSLYSVTGENKSNSELTFLPKLDAFGSDRVTLWLTSSDSNNHSISQPLWINLTPVNDPPIIYGIPDLIIHYDDPYTFNYEPYVDDKDNAISELELEIFDGHDKNYITISGLNATFDYPKQFVGQTFYSTVVVSDGEAQRSDLFSISITSDHVPKLVQTLPDVLLYEGTTEYNVFDLDDYFMDEDMDAIFFSYGQTNVVITINQDHTVDITAASEWTGTELVTFRARDPMGALAEDSIIVTVIPMNDPPVISGVPDFFVHSDVDYRFDLTPYVYDKDNTVKELTIIPSDLEHIRIDEANNLVIIINYPLKYLNLSIPVRLTVDDGLDSNFQDIIVKVTDDYPPELIRPLPDIEFFEDRSITNILNLNNYFFDIDGDALYYTTGNNHINITINEDHTVDCSAPRDWFGTELVYFRANDPMGALQEDLVIVTVFPVNDPPVLLSLPTQYGNESERWVLDLEPFILDVDNNITEITITTDSDYVVASGSTLNFLGSQEMPKQVVVTVTDGEYSASQTIDIRLKRAKRVQTPTLWDLFVQILPFIIIILLIILVVSAFIYRRRTQFTAEEVFLIHSGGTLITHLTRHQQANVDDIIFSGMFTAVQEFIKDTFTSSEGQSGEVNDQWLLDELKLGDDKIMIERSDHTYLAVIFSGPGSKRLRRIVSGLLEEIEDKYDKILPEWDGNISELEETKQILSVLIDIPKDSDIKMARPVDNLSPAEPALHAPLATKTQTTVKTVESKMLTIAKPIQRQNIRPRSIGLLSSTGKQLGLDQPGLTAWPLTSAYRRKKRLKYKGIDIEEIPIAMHISAKRQRQKTILISKNRSAVKDKPTPIAKNTSHGLDGPVLAKPVNVVMPGSDKPFTFDPNKSLMAQLADMDN